jgi:hypothetical protein
MASKSPVDDLLGALSFSEPLGGAEFFCFVVIYFAFLFSSPNIKVFFFICSRFSILTNISRPLFFFEIKFSFFATVFLFSLRNKKNLVIKRKN